MVGGGAILAEKVAWLGAILVEKKLAHAGRLEVW